MASDDKTFSDTHEVTRLTIQSNTQISAKATSTISKLSSQDSGTPKPALVILHAQSRWASKLISIVEIAKRDLESKGVKVFQYTAVSSEIVEVERKPKPKGVEAAPQDGEASDDDAFQSMGADEEGGMKKRAVPVMTVYLATQSVKALKSELGWVL